MQLGLIGLAFLFGSLNTSLIPSGENIVFEMKIDGLYVTGTYQVKIEDEYYNPSIDSDIQIGDIIVKLNEKKVSSVDSFLSVIKDNKYDEVTLDIIRNKTLINRNLRLCYENNQIKSGLYVKERILGVGTLTYYDPVNKTYGALGHEVIDSYTGQIIDINNGNIYKEDVLNISKSTNGKVGEKITTTKFDNDIGDIYKNTEYGMFGPYTCSTCNKNELEVASINQIKLGKAKILTCLKGNNVEEFEIKITELKKQTSKQTKGITFEITDKRLLLEAGGVYSGMSGSPIIQNNMIVGAVTHILVNDVTKGYGVYIEYMYQEQLNNVA